MTRGTALLLGLGILALGGGGFALLRSGGLDATKAGIAASSLLLLIVVIWTGSYLLRVVSGRMTYMEQRRRYRAIYDARTTRELQQKFDALSPEDQQKLLAEFGQVEADAEM